jgi:hypothetical protein
MTNLDLDAAAQNLSNAASDLLAKGTRVLGDGGVVAQMASGAWTAEASDTHTAEGLELLAAQATELAERIRRFRAAAPATSARQQSLKDEFAGTLGRLLPMNRKERFFTGSVLPGLLSHDNLANLGVFTELCGLHVGPFEGVRASEIQIWSEYGFAESVFKPEDRSRFDGFDTAKDTPDVVIVGPDWLLAVEAKVYDWPDVGALRTQLDRQKSLVDYWTTALSLDPHRVKHVALLPAGYVSEAKPNIDQDVVSWEAVADAYRRVGPNYWLDVLDVALEQWDDLVSKTRHLQFGSNSEATMTGQQIFDAFSAGTLTFAFMGRQGGLDGPGLAQDISTGGWRRRVYEVRSTPIAARNWFAVDDFIARVDTRD